MRKEKVFSYIKDDGKIAVQKLSFIDQLLVLFKKLTFDDAAELKREEMISRETLKLKSNLIDLVLGATELIRNGEHRSVHIKISSKFESVIDEVLPTGSNECSGRFAPYYNITIKKPALEYDVEHFLDVWLEAKT